MEKIVAILLKNNLRVSLCMLMNTERPKKTYGDTLNTDFQCKKVLKKYTIYFFVCDIIRFCY